MNPHHGRPGARVQKALTLLSFDVANLGLQGLYARLQSLHGAPKAEEISKGATPAPYELPTLSDVPSHRRRPGAWIKEELARLSDRDTDLGFEELQGRLMSILERVKTEEEAKGATPIFHEFPLISNMSPHRRRPGAWLKDELRLLSSAMDHQDFKDFQARLQSLLERVKTEEKATSAATQVFNTYELAEMILEKLPTGNMITAQRICTSTQDVVFRSQRIRRDLVAYPAHTILDTDVFKYNIDFNAMEDGDGPYFYSKPGDIFNWRGPGRSFKKDFELVYEVRWGAKVPQWIKKQGLKLKPDRTIIFPRKAAARSDDGTSSRCQRPGELWRKVIFTNGLKSLEVKLGSRCGEGSRRHWWEITRRFGGEVTLG